MAHHAGSWLWILLLLALFAQCTIGETADTRSSSTSTATTGAGAVGEQKEPIAAVGDAQNDHVALPKAESGTLEGGKSNEPQMSKWASEATTQLRSIRPKKGRFSTLERKSGLLGSSIYYAKRGFVLLFMNGPPQESDTQLPKLSGPLSKASDLLEEGVAEDDPDSQYLLAELSFFGNYSYPRDYKRAFQLYHTLASRTGNSTAQHMVGFMYATGVGDAVERDQAKALVYHTFAAKQGNTRAQMTVGFRHHSGIGTPRNCHEAVLYYKHVADKAIEYARSGPPGGLPLTREAYHIADDNGGVYGDGASFSSSGHNARRGGPGSDQHSPFDDVMEYLDLLSRKGDLKATFGLGRINYDGSRTVKRNFKTARKYFMQVASQYWDKNGKVISDDTLVVGKTAAKAAAFLGRLHLRGEGVPQNYEKALRWFKLGVSNADAYCQYEMGLMYLYGLGVKKDIMMASSYFKEAAQQDWPAAQSNLGKIFLDQGDLKTASAYFELAVRHGHVEAFYHLAELNNFGIGRERSCDVAASYYKVVVEKAEALHSDFGEANLDYDNGDKTSALIKYMMAAEQGYEQAQSNVAFLFDERKSIFSLDRILPWKKPAPNMLRNAALALVYWTRSAKQFNIDSMIKMGDSYLDGYGVDADAEKAAQCYQSAAEMDQSAQALWNLGWMHENGLGVEQDFHLASRCYLDAADANSESYLPVWLSLKKLQVRSWWNQLTDGKVNPINLEPEEPKRHRTWSEWLAHFLEDDAAYYAYDDPDYLGGDGMPAGDEYYLDEIDAGVLETVTMLALAAALAFLVYYRQLRQQNHQRAVAEQRDRQGADAGGGAGGAAAAALPDGVVHDGPDQGQPLQPGQQPDGGFFPAPDDPDWDMWAAGGVGH